ncbi:MAG: hypothetical protein WEC74_09410 [Gammaproteobacteria bacterium]
MIRCFVALWPPAELRDALTSQTVFIRTGFDARAPTLTWQGPPLEWRVDDIALRRSDGTDAGVRYSVVARTAPASVR